MHNLNILPFSKIIEPYEAVIFDIWGVVFDGIDPYPGAIEQINNLIKQKKKIFFLSNNPRPNNFVKSKLEKLGINLSNAIVYTSGDAVREQLVSWNDPIFKNLGRKFYHLGKEKNTDIINGLEVDIVDDIEQANFILLTCYADNDEEFNKYNDLLAKAISLELLVICANPDIIVHEGNKIRRCAGAFGKKYSEMGGKVHYYGKPDAKIFTNLINKYLSNTPKDKIIMVGDTLETDIQGANKVGIDSVLLLTGNGKNSLKTMQSESAKINPVIPTWISDGLY